MNGTILISLDEDGIRRVSLLSASEEDEEELFGLYKSVRWVLHLLDSEILNAGDVQGAV